MSDFLHLAGTASAIGDPSRVVMWHIGGILGAAILRRLIDGRLARRVKGREMSVAGLQSVLSNLELSRVHNP